MPVKQQYLHSDITDKILTCVHKVHDALGPGFSEKLYENALVLELRDIGVSVHPQYPIKVKYKDVVIGEFIADLLVEEKVVVELKALDKLLDLHETQLLNYLKTTGIRVGLLINFGEAKPTYKRRIV